MCITTKWSNNDDPHHIHLLPSVSSKLHYISIKYAIVHKFFLCLDLEYFLFVFSGVRSDGLGMYLDCVRKSTKMAEIFGHSVPAGCLLQFLFHFCPIFRLCTDDMTWMFASSLKPHMRPMCWADAFTDRFASCLFFSVFLPSECHFSTVPIVFVTVALLRRIKPYDSAILRCNLLTFIIQSISGMHVQRISDIFAKSNQRRQ